MAGKEEAELISTSRSFEFGTPGNILEAFRLGEEERTAKMEIWIDMKEREVGGRQQ